MQSTMGWILQCSCQNFLNNEITAAHHMPKKKICKQDIINLRRKQFSKLKFRKSIQQKIPFKKKKEGRSAREVAQQLRGPAALQSLVRSTQWLLTACSSSTRGSDTLSSSHGHLHTYTNAQIKHLFFF